MLILFVRIADLASGRAFSVLKDVFFFVFRRLVFWKTSSQTEDWMFRSLIVQDRQQETTGDAAAITRESYRGPGEPLQN